MFDSSTLLTVPLILFVISVSYTLYILFGYPVILAVLARFKSRPVHRDPSYAPYVSVILTVRNGEQWISAKLANLLSGLDYPADRMEVIVISDGSDDGTDDIVQACRDSRVRFECIPRAGKSAALNRGISLAKGEILFLTDVRQPLDRECLHRLTACFADPEIGAVSGELIILKGSTLEELHVGLYWKYEKAIRKRLSAIGSVFGASGSIYAIRRALVRPLPPSTLDDDVYLPLCAFFAGYRVIFDDSAVAYDYPTGLGSEYYRKVRTLAGVYQVIGFFPRLLLPTTRGWFHFMSHKFGRMLMPWVLLIGAASSLFLPHPIRGGILALEIFLTASALLDPAVREGSFIKRWTSVNRTFLVLMWAAASATAIFFRPADTLWRPVHKGVAETPARPDDAVASEHPAMKSVSLPK